MARTETYRDTHVTTASPMQLIIMLYDECITTLQKAEDAFNIEGPDRFQEINNKVLHAQDIITELSISLDMEQGGEIADNLQRLYEFMVAHLSEANIKKTSQPIKEIRELMIELRDTWKQVDAKNPQEKQREFTHSEIDNILVKG